MPTPSQEGNLLITVPPALAVTVGEVLSGPVPGLVAKG